MTPASKRTKSRRSVASPRSMAASPESQIAGFLAKYTPAMIASGREARRKMRQVIPGGVEFVYDNYNALVFGFGPTDRPSDAVLSLALMPRWVTLCFLKGTKLADPKKILRGSGNVVRNVRLSAPVDLDDPYIKRLIDDSIANAAPAFPAGGEAPRTIIKSVSAKQRPRRPQ